MVIHHLVLRVTFAEDAEKFNNVRILPLVFSDE